MTFPLNPKHSETTIANILNLLNSNNEKNEERKIIGRTKQKPTAKGESDGARSWEATAELRRCTVVCLVAQKSYGLYTLQIVLGINTYIYAYISIDILSCWWWQMRVDT